MGGNWTGGPGWQGASQFPMYAGLGTPSYPMYAGLSGQYTDPLYARTSTPFTFPSTPPVVTPATTGQQSNFYNTSGNWDSFPSALSQWGGYVPNAQGLLPSLNPAGYIGGSPTSSSSDYGSNGGGGGFILPVGTILGGLAANKLFGNPLGKYVAAPIASGIQQLAQTLIKPITGVDPTVGTGGMLGNAAGDLPGSRIKNAGNVAFPTQPLPTTIQPNTLTPPQGVSLGALANTPITGAPIVPRTFASSPTGAELVSKLGLLEGVTAPRPMVIPSDPFGGPRSPIPPSGPQAPPVSQGFATNTGVTTDVPIVSGSAPPPSGVIPPGSLGGLAPAGIGALVGLGTGAATGNPAGGAIAGAASGLIGTAAQQAALDIAPQLGSLGAGVAGAGVTLGLNMLFNSLFGGGPFSPQDYTQGDLSKEIMTAKQNYFSQYGNQAQTEAIKAAPDFRSAIMSLSKAPGGTSGQVQFGIGNQYAGETIPGSAGTTETPGWASAITHLSDPQMIANNPDFIANAIQKLWVQTGQSGATGFDPGATRSYQTNLLSKLPNTPEWLTAKQMILNSPMTDPRVETDMQNQAPKLAVIPNTLRVNGLKIPTDHQYKWYDGASGIWYDYSPERVAETLNPWNGSTVMDMTTGQWIGPSATGMNPAYVDTEAMATPWFKARAQKMLDVDTPRIPPSNDPTAYNPIDMNAYGRLQKFLGITPPPVAPPLSNANYWASQGGGE